MCQYRNDPGLITEVTVKLNRISKRQFLLKISGNVSDFPSYLKLTISQSESFLQQLDVLIYELSLEYQNENNFWLEFQIEISDNDNTNLPFLLILYLSDCYKTVIR